MVKASIHELDRLIDSPRFSDEIDGSCIDRELMRMLNVEKLRIVPAKSAMTGIYGIYFREEHTEEALVRYAKRYRWIFETLLRAGMFGEFKLKEQGLSKAEVDFLRRIVPNTDHEHNPVVYEVLWRSRPFEEYIYIVDELADVHGGKFKPIDIIQNNDHLTMSDGNFFDYFVRKHIIESIETANAHIHNNPENMGDSMHVDLEAWYHLTEEGEEFVPVMLSEYERIFIQENFEPIEWNGEAEIKNTTEKYDSVQLATSEEDDVIGSEQTDLTDFRE